MANLKDLIVNGSARILGNLYATLKGNADTATKLETARTIRTNLGSTSAVGFDGSANITPGIQGTLGVANGGTGQTSVANIQAGKDADGNIISSTYLKQTDQGNLLPNFDAMPVLQTVEFDTADSDYHVICTRTNTDTSEAELNDVLYFRITVTGTNINQVGNYAVILPGKINCQPFVIANMFSGTSNSAYGGNRYLGYVYPKTLSNGYSWEICILNNRNNSARHYKVEVFKTNSKCTWSAGTTTTYDSTYQGRGTMDVETRYGYVFNYMYGGVTNADNASQLSSRLQKFINCTINTAGAALLANQFVYQNGNSLYPATDKTRAIEPGFGIQLNTYAYNSGNSVGWDQIRQKVSITSLTNIPHATLARGNPCYFRCTMAANGNIVSDNYVTTSMANGYTWYYIGIAQSATAIALDTTQSFFITLDSSGKLTHINGKELTANMSGYVPTSRKINNKALTSDITLSASDVSALPSSTVIPTVVDTYSATGTDAVSGKGVKAALDTLTIPTTTDSVTSGSTAALTSGGAYTNLVRRKSTSAATGSTSQGVYVDANGQVQTCTAVTSTYSGTGTAPVNGTAVKSAIDAVLSSVYKPAGSVAFASLPTPASSIAGNVYDVTDAFTTDSKFVTSGQSYPAGTNVVVINTTGTTYKYDVLTGFVDLSNYQLTETAVTHTKNTAAGSATQPVYIASDGTATSTTYALNKTVPSDAVFTDTKNTAGSTDTSSKIFLVGATSQAANPQTYSHDTAFVDTNGRLNSAAPASGANDTTVATTKWVKDQAYAADSGVVKLTTNQEISGTKTFNAEIKGVFAAYQSHNSETGGYYKKIGEIILTGAYQSAVVPFYYYKDAVNVTETGYTGKISLRVDGTAGTFGPNNSGVVLGEYPDWINNGNMAFYVLYKNNTPESNKVTCQVWTYVKNAWDGFKIMPLSYHGYGQSSWTWTNNPTGVTELPSDYTAINQKFARMYITAPNEDTTSSAQLDTVGARNTKLASYSTTANTVSAVVAGTSANQIKVTKNGSDSTITVNNVANATNATKATQDASGNVITTTYLPKSSQGDLLPNFDDMPVIETKEFNTADGNYHQICTRTNTDASINDLNDILYFRITVTGTSINHIMDCAVLLKGTLASYPQLVYFSKPGTTDNAYTGIRYLRLVYPKALSNGYGWAIEVCNNRNSNARHYKVEVFKTNSKVTWVTGTTSTYNSTYQNGNTPEIGQANGYGFNYINGSIGNATWSSSINSYLCKYTTLSTAPLTGAALLAGQFAFMNNNKVYPATTKTLAIEPGFGIVYNSTAYNNNTSIGWDRFREKTRITSFTNIPKTTLARGNACYFRCTMDANGNILSDNYVSNAMTAGYTWYYVGLAESDSAISIDTSSSKFLTLDASGNLTHVDGKKIAGSSATAVTIRSW